MSRLPVDEAAESSPDQTVLSAASSLPPSMQYDDRTLRAELVKLGFNPGPIQDSTRTLYLKKLRTLKKKPTVVKNDQGKSKLFHSLTPIFIQIRSLLLSFLSSYFTDIFGDNCIIYRLCLSYFCHGLTVLQTIPKNIFAKYHIA